MLNFLLFAICAVSLILMRPIACLFFLPFAFYPKIFLKYGLAALAVAAIYIAFVFSNPVQKANWTDYFTALPIHVKIHQGFYKNKPDSAHAHLMLQHFEGISNEGLLNQQQVEKTIKNTECSNFYIMYEKIAGHRPSIKIMTYAGIITSAIILLPLFWFVKKKVVLSYVELLILGFVVYEVFSFCSPIMRPNYCWVEFLFPLLLVPVIFNKVYITQQSFLLVGFCLNVFAPTIIPVRQNIGELLILLAFLLQIYRPILFSCFNETKWKLRENIYWL